MGRFPKWMRVLALFILSQVVFWTFLYQFESLVRPVGGERPETVQFSTSQSNTDWASSPMTPVTIDGSPSYRIYDMERAKTGLFIHTFQSRLGRKQALLLGWPYRVLEVRLNGTLLTSQNHKASWGLTSEFFPVMYVFPDELIREEGNTLTFRVKGNRLKVLPPIYVGEVNSIATARAWGQYATVDLPAVAIGLMVFVALLTAIIVWPKEDQLRAYALVGLLSAWTIKNFVHLGFDALVSDGFQQLFYFFVTYGFLFALLGYALVASRAPRNLFIVASIGFFAAFIVMSGAAAFGIRQLLELGLRVELVLTLATCAGAWFLLARAYIQNVANRPLELFVFALCMTALSVDVIDDIADISHPFTPHLELMYYVSPFFGAVLAFGIVVSLGVQSSRANAMLASLNTILKERLSEKEVELNAVHERERRIERERVLIEERKRIMRDMHDGLGGQLMSLVARIKSDPGTDKHGIAEGLTGAIDELRLIVDSLDTAGDDLGAALGAIRSRIEPGLGGAGVRLVWDIDEDASECSLPAGKILNIYRILQEACANTLRHADAAEFEVSLQRQEMGLSLIISDDGSWDQNTSIHGKGLSNMQTRAAQLGGELALLPNSPGLKITLDIPECFNNAD